MAWIHLLIASTCEVIWAIALKYSNGFTHLTPSIVTVIGYIASFYFLSMATRTLPIGTAYTIWSGFGVLGTAILGVVLFGEQVTFFKALFLLLILTGIIGLRIV